MAASFVLAGNVELASACVSSFPIGLKGNLSLLVICVYVAGDSTTNEPQSKAV